MVLPPVNPFKLPEKRYVANVFIDLCGSTQASERLSDSQELFDLLDRWQKLAAFVLCNYGGKIGASDSDLVMGYFIGSETENMAISRALLAAARVREKTIEFGQQTGFPLNVHIGLHCGHVEIGVIGPEARNNLTTIGAPVNIAARLEGKAQKGEIFVSQNVKDQLKIRWEGESVGEQTLKGIKSPLICYRIRSVGFSSLPESSLSESDWIFSVIEAQALENIGRYTEALQFAEAAVSSRKDKGTLNPKLSFLAFETQIRCLRQCQRSAEAMKMAERYAELALALSAQMEYGHAQFYRGLCLVDQSAFNLGLKVMGEARQVYLHYGNQRNIADALFFIGICYQSMQMTTQAREAFERAKENYFDFIYDQQSDPAEAGKACLELSLLLADDPERANEVLVIAQRAFHETCQFRYLVTVYLNWSCIQNTMWRPTHAENFARRALELAKDFDPIDGVGHAHVNIGAALENRSRFNDAKVHYEKALEIAIQTGHEQWINKLRERILRADEREKHTFP